MNMHVDNTSQAPATDIELDAIRGELCNLGPSSRRQTRQQVHKLLPEIQAALDRGATQKGALQILKSHGISMSIATLRRMLEANRDQREQLEPSIQSPPVAGKVPTQQTSPPEPVNMNAYGIGCIRSEPIDGSSSDDC